MALNHIIMLALHTTLSTNKDAILTAMEIVLMRN